MTSVASRKNAYSAFWNVLGRLYAAGGLKTTFTEYMTASLFDNIVDVFDLKKRSLTMSTRRVEPCGVATETEVVIDAP